MERDRLEQEQKAGIGAWRANRAKFIENAAGSLRDMWAPEIKKIVDTWREGYWACEENDRAEFFSVENFYKVFGRPKRIALIENASLNDAPPGFIIPEEDSYYFYYNCKGGVAQIEVDAEDFGQGIVYIPGLNIF